VWYNKINKGEQTMNAETIIRELKSISESIQDDLICLLDSQFGEVEYIDEVKTMACQIVVDRFKGVGEEV
jgi:hypothetical protein